MNYRALLSFAGLIALFFIAGTSGTGCANIVPPQGGVRDSLPPIVTRVSPRDSTRNFRGDRISLSFDEYIDLDNIQKNLIVSPIPNNTPTITRKLSSIYVKLRDSLEENTTYSINFGSAIKDVNEGNIMKNYTYIFSTGNYIDSMQFSGKVLIAETGNIDTTLTILLHRSNDDSALINEKPRYVTKIDSRGNFRFRNLPPGTFYVFALKDEGGSYRYQASDQLFAFADSAVQVNSNTKPVTLFAYSIPKKVAVTAPVAETNSRSKPNAADRRLKFSSNLADGKQDLLTKFSFNFERTLKNFDPGKIAFSTDSTYTPITEYSWLLDSTRKKATLTYEWKENTVYHFILQKDFATDSLGQQLLRTDTINFSSKALVEYGKLNLRFKNLDLSKNLVLIFIYNNEKKYTFPLTANTLTMPLFLPGEYTLHLLEDLNKNGVWDPGAFFGKHLQPELVKPLQRKLTIKPNQNIPVEIDLNAIEDPSNPTPPPNQTPALNGQKKRGPGR